MTQQYWEGGYQYSFGETRAFSVEMTFEATLALKLIEHFGAVAGKRGRVEGATSDPGLELQSPEELVDRCLEIARLYMDKVTALAMIRPRARTLTE